MLRKFWRWFIGDKEDPMIELFQLMVANQERTTQSVLDAVKQIGMASERQADVLNQYLKLFQTPGEPTRWEFNQEEVNKGELEKMGFPADKSDTEQAEWILRNIERL